MEDMKNPQTLKSSVLSAIAAKWHVAYTGRTNLDRKTAQIPRPIQVHPNGKDQQAARTSQQGRSVTAGAKGSLRHRKKRWEDDGDDLQGQSILITVLEGNVPTHSVPPACGRTPTPVAEHLPVLCWDPCRAETNWPCPEGPQLELLTVWNNTAFCSGSFHWRTNPIQVPAKPQCRALVPKEFDGAIAFWYRGGIWTDGWRLVRKSRTVSLGKNNFIYFGKVRQSREFQKDKS